MLFYVQLPHQIYHTHFAALYLFQKIHVRFLFSLLKLIKTEFN